MTTSTSSGISTSGPFLIKEERPAALFLLAAGVWLAVLQVDLFLSLELLLSSAFVTYVTVVLAWLVGAAAGVWFRTGIWTAVLMGISGVAPYVSMLLLELAPYETSLIWIHGLLVAVTALFAGQVFQQERRSFRQIGSLFFWENTGFIVGLVAGVLGFVLFGRSFLYVAPGLGLVAVLALGAWRKMHGRLEPGADLLRP